jgi:phosphatidylinositol kinase/protein kinase (PI-3  family)|tara:strand:- start:606 stop:866 length:261 start_codon:yes stop_codon:yes gene_type:complete
MQLIETINLIFKRRKLKLGLTTYDILSTGENCGIVQFIPESYSIDYIKKKIRSNTKNLQDENSTVDLKSFYKLNFTGSNRNKVTYK